MSQHKIQKVKHKLLLGYNEFEDGREICKGEENSSWPSFEPLYISVSFSGLYLIDTNKDIYGYQDVYCDSSVSVGDKIHLLVVRYADGDTFTYTSGKWYVMWCSYDLEIINKLKNILSKESHGDNINISFLGHKIYIPWYGYFASLEDIQIYSFVVEQFCFDGIAKYYPLNNTIEH